MIEVRDIEMALALLVETEGRPLPSERFAEGTGAALDRAAGAIITAAAKQNDKDGGKGPDLAMMLFVKGIVFGQRLASVVNGRSMGEEIAGG